MATKEPRYVPAAPDGVEAWVRVGSEIEREESERRAVMRGMRFDTIAVHGIYGMQAALQNQGSILEPAFLSPAQHFADSDQMEAALSYRMPAWAYSRIANPTLHFLEETIALLEAYGSDVEARACVTASGMAAVFMATNPFLVDDPSLPPPNIVASAKCYGGTFQLFSERYSKERGIEVRWIREPLDPASWAEAVDAGTRFLYAETPSNPALAIVDVTAIARIAHGSGVPLIVDATVATPALLRPLGLGADIVVHSVSKAMAGSGLAIAGALVARRGIPSRVGPDGLRADFASHVKLLPFRDHGPALAPFNALMALTDLRTLRTRLDLWSRNAERIARFLGSHQGVEAVHYPGLESHPGHSIARRDMWIADGDDDGRPANRFGPLLAFDVAGGATAARRTFDRLKLIWRATDLGRVKSVATIPAISTHQQQGEAGRDLAGVPDNQIRLSVGGEHPDDLIADLEHALG